MAHLRSESTNRYPVGLDVIMNFAAFQDASSNSSLYENAVKLRPVETMLRDIRTGNLPPSHGSFRRTTSASPRHATRRGRGLLAAKLEAFWSNPAVWSRTAFILVYDENDGLFDHVVPPTPPLGTPGEFIGEMPIGLGFRVPCLVISSFSRGGFVCGDTFDHTSTLRLIEARFGVEVPNLTKWRRETCGDFTTAFGFGEPANTRVPTLPRTAELLSRVEQQVAVLPRPRVPAVQAMPKPEAGAIVRRRRPSRRLSTAPLSGSGR